MSEPVRLPVRKETQVIGESKDYPLFGSVLKRHVFKSPACGHPPENSAEQQKKATQSGVAFFISSLLNPSSRFPTHAEIIRLSQDRTRRRQTATNPPRLPSTSQLPGSGTACTFSMYRKLEFRLLMMSVLTRVTGSKTARRVPAE